MKPLTLIRLAVLLLATACGSTVQQSSTVSQGGFSDLGTTGGTSASTSGATGGTSTTGSTSGGTSLSGSAGGGTSGTGSAVPTSTTGGAHLPGGTTGGSTGSSVPKGALATKGFGYDATHVYIGVVTQNDAQKAFATFGANNVDPGDTDGQVNAVVADINSRGGIFGRKVVPVFKDVATVATATNPESVGSQVCSFFAQDHHVVAVLSIVTVLDYPNFRACLAHAKIPLFSGAVKAVDNKASSALAPYFYQTAAVSWDALAPVLVSRLKAQGWFSGWNTTLGQAGGAPVKVGVLTDGTDIGKRVGQTMKRTLAAAGYPGALVFNYAQASDGQSASVQYFNGNNVTHVIVTDVELTAFQTSAATQNYKPRYGISSYNDPYSNLEASGLTPKGANNGAMGVGWNPGLDVSQANDPGAGKGAANCLRIMRKGGQNLSGKRLAITLADSLCDGLLLVEQGAEAGGGLDGVRVAAGIVQVGPTYSPAGAFGPALTSVKHFVAGKARDLAWYPACSCFKYGSGSASL